MFTTDGKSASSNYGDNKRRLDALLPADMPPWRLHDLRRTAASGMARLGVNLPAIEKVLNHSSGSFGGMVGVYQRHDLPTKSDTRLSAGARMSPIWFRAVAAGMSSGLRHGLKPRVDALAEAVTRAGSFEALRPHAVQRGHQGARGGDVRGPCRRADKNIDSLMVGRGHHAGLDVGRPDALAVADFVMFAILGGPNDTPADYL